MEEKIIFENKKLVKSYNKNFADDFNYCDLAVFFLNTVPLDKLSLDDMYYRLDLYKVFKDARLQPSVKITKKQLSKVLNAYLGIKKWGVIDDNFPLFHEYLKTLKDE